MAELQRLEAQANGYAKPRFLDAWLRPTATRQTLVHERDGTADGFATVRRCAEGFKIGPLVAQSAETAIALLHAAGQITGDAPAMIDLPAENRALQRHCAEIGMAVSFSTARMYRGPAPAPGLPWRAIATLELG